MPEPEVLSRILGISTRCYPFQDVLSPYGQSMNPPRLKVVLVAGDIGDYAAYAGYGDEEFVVRLGNKISFEEACCHFPGQLDREKYRN